MEDIERQLRGDGFAEDIMADTSCSPQRPAQKRLVEALTAPVEATLEGNRLRRNRAIDAVTAYCFVEEGCVVRRARAPLDTKRPATPRHRPVDSPLRVATRFIFVKNEKERPKICFVCVGKALSLITGRP